MIINEVITGSIAVVIGYLLGSITFAYIVTRLLTGKDIRRLGGGNAGARNTFREVGLRAATIVAIFDVGKGVAAVIIAHRLLEVPLHEPNLFILLTGLAAVAGHMWPLYLKFTGGNGLGAAIGVLAIVLPWQLLIVLGLMFLLTIFTRNLVLSLNISLLTLPVSAWLMEASWMYGVFSILLLVIMILNFIPTAKAALVKTGSKENLVSELLPGKRG